MVRRGVFTFLACSFLIAAPRAHAEGMPESILRLKPNTTVRIEAASFGRIEGQFLRATDDTLFLSNQKSETGVPLSYTRNLWQRGRATRNGAIIGGLIGAIGMILLAEAVASTSDEPHGDPAAGAGIAGAAGGALLGGLIGAAIPQWHHRYP